MPQVLFELGCEELPATFVRKAYTQLAQEIVSRLDEAGVGHGASQALGTPRRLIVCVDDVADRQPDRTSAQRGPALKAAYDGDGNPSPALLGFCRGQGVDLSAVRPDGDYVWVDKTSVGKPTRELLAEILPAAVRALTFDKSMRWGSSRMRFARPIRWFLAAFGGEVVQFDVEGVKSGLKSRGHRFNFPDEFEVKSYDELLRELRARHVEPDPAVREERIRSGAAAVAGGQAQLSDVLVDENVFLTEWPTAVAGRFRSEFLTLPEPVLVIAMAKHERMFPVRDESGKITDRFVAIRNAGIDEVVSAGNAWVLNARFNDAKFFYDEDQKFTLSEFLEKTERMSFQEKLGSVRQRSQRLAALADQVGHHTGATEEERSLAERAAFLAKADLSTGLVSELPSLQGVVGGEYARREGIAEAICYAIATHYDLAKNPSPKTVAEKTAVRVLIADQLDKLAGYLGIGLAPSGSSDPYGLRRAATLLIEAAWSWPDTMPTYVGLFQSALDHYERQGIKLDHAGALNHLVQVFTSRYEALLDDFRHDHLDAALLPEPGEILLPRLVRFRAQAVREAAKDVAFIQTATRPLNIVAAAEKKGAAYERVQPLDRLDRNALDSPEGVALAEELAAIREGLSAAVRLEDAAGAVAILKRLQAPINAFFEAAMIMVDDERVRHARLTLLEACRHEILLIGDLSKVIIDG
ncbi:MAG: glycine--tRNA ligase subunit beta [Fimbriimonadaceae bacterium]|nr:glycine--tRNA ligase subunit beta [Fimbriimonadaceae bacterium]